jgi:predicted helicase
MKKDIKITKWKKLSPKSEFYIYMPRDEKLLKTYEEYPKINEIFPLNSVGIVTARDGFVIDCDQKALERRIRMFRDEKMPDELIRQTYHLRDKANWKLKAAREGLKKHKNWEDSIKEILYRPFDIQWIFYHDALIERPRYEVMQHMLKDNLALITHKREELDISWSHALVTNTLTEHGSLSTKTTNYLFPLYLYQVKNNPGKRHSDNVVMLFEPKADYGSRKSNLSPALIEQLSKNYKKTPTPEQILFYTYAVLYSNIYRKKYVEFLKIDFPRIPFTKSYKIFSKMAKYGKKLVALHLLKSTALDPPVTKFQGRGNKRIEKVKYEKKRVYVNKDQYFERIKQELWEYKIGGYQVCAKWLKDRKGRSLSLDDIKHYCNIVTALKKTIETQKAIDKIYPEVEKKTVDYMHNTD